MFNNIKLIILISLLFITLPFYGFCDWAVEDYKTVFGTTDKPIKICWNHINSNQYHIEVRFIVTSTNSSEVTYNIYDGDSTTPTYTTTIDQTDETNNNKWVLLGWYNPAFTGTIRVEASNTTNNLCIDAVRLSHHHCDEQSLIISNERDDNAVYTGTWSLINTGGYDDSYVVSTGPANHVWTFNDLAISNSKLSFDYYFQQVETDRKTEIKNTDKYYVNEMLPRSGHYVFFNRTRTPFNTGELDSYNRATLESRNISSRCEVVVTDEMTDDELRNLMYEYGKHSVWVNTTMEETTLHMDCSRKKFWIYGHIAPPGQIIID